MNYLNSPIKRYLKDLSARTPAPGGGSAAALCLAFAAGLLAMAARFSLGKKELKRSEGRIRTILKRSLQAQKKAAVLAQEDIEAYGAKDWKRALEVPAEVCLLSYDVMQGARELLVCGNKNLISDTRLAVLLTRVSFISAFSYVVINARATQGKDRHEKLIAGLKTLLKEVRKIGEKEEGRIGYSLGR